MTDDDASRPTRAAMVSAVVLATLIGAAVRAVHVLLVDFPLNDGALFLAMTRDLVGNGFVPPAITSYNGADIPFAYPPLGLYVAGFVSVLGMDLLNVFRFVPLAVSILTIPATFLFASVALPTRFAALVATIAFALIPRGFEWLIAGGGVTRAFGLLFAILVLWAGLRLERDRTRANVLLLGVLSGLAALSHPEAVVVAGWWLLVVLVTSKDRTAVLRSFLAAAAVAALFALPWLAFVVATHGAEALFGAGRAGFGFEDGLIYLLTFKITDEPFITLIAALALVGILARLRHADWRWLLWTLIIVIDPRGGTTYVAPILGGAAAIALVDVLLPAFRTGEPKRSMVWPDATIGRAARGLLALCLAVGVAGAVGARTNDRTPLFALSPSTVEAIQRVEASTAPDDVIVVVSGAGWSVDATAEWLPVLASRRSASTVQGAEWTGSDGWASALASHQVLTGCAFESVECFERWLASDAPDATHVFLPRGAASASPNEVECCPALRAPLAAAGFPVVFDEPGGTLLALP